MVYLEDGAGCLDVGWYRKLDTLTGIGQSGCSVLFSFL